MDKFEKKIMFDFDEYIRQGEPSQVEKSQNWKIAIGLQQVDGLTPSAFLIETAKENIEGDITIEEVKKRIDVYYKTSASKQAEKEERTEEADKVSARIAEILSEQTFSFSPTEYTNIHRRLFYGIYKFAGKIRDYNITKSEWVLNGDTVLYAGADNLKATLEYDFEQEKKFDFKGLSQEQILEHIARFIADLWQIHPFGEGNTRATAVFLIKYLRKHGFEDTNNDMFAQHSWYFRNALVRANYKNLKSNIFVTYTYLEYFLRNILFGEKNELKNRYLHIHHTTGENKTENVVEIDTVNQEKFLVNGKKFLVNGKKFPVIGLEIIKLIENNPNITIIDLSKMLNISDRAVKNNLNKLKMAGIISREGSDKKGSWKVIK